MTAKASTLAQEIRAAFDTWVAAWNRGDLDGYNASYYPSDTTILVSNTTIFRGYEAVTDRYRTHFDTPEKMGTITLAELEIESTSETGAMVLGIVKHAVGGEESDVIFTAHLRKIDGRWYITSEHVTG